MFSDDISQNNLQIYVDQLKRNTTNAYYNATIKTKIQNQRPHKGLICAKKMVGEGNKCLLFSILFVT